MENCNNVVPLMAPKFLSQAPRSERQWLRPATGEILLRLPCRSTSDLKAEWCGRRPADFGSPKGLPRKRHPASLGSSLRSRPPRVCPERSLRDPEEIKITPAVHSNPSFVNSIIRGDCIEVMRQMPPNRRRSNGGTYGVSGRGNSGDEAADLEKAHHVQIRSIEQLSVLCCANGTHNRRCGPGYSQ